MSGRLEFHGEETSGASTNRPLTAVVPVFSPDLDHINFFYNDEGRFFYSIEELLEAPFDRYYILEYDIFWRIFEKWYKEHDFKVKFTEKLYTGTPRKYNFIVPSIAISEMSVGMDTPRVMKSRGSYNGKRFRFFDLAKFIRGVTNFNVSLEVLQNAIPVIETFESIGQKSKKGGYYPNSIAGLSRVMFGDPTKMNTKERARYCLNVRSSYRGGLYYLDKTLVRFPVVFDYDVSSMYPFILLSQAFPDIKVVPELKDGFIEVDNKTELAIYHIKRLEAKRKPHVLFNTMFTVIEEQDRLLKAGLSISKEGRIHTIKNLPEIDGWITSIDLFILRRDYDITELDIDHTYHITKVVNGSRIFNTLQVYYKKKQESTGELRKAYKLLIDSYSGNLGAVWTKSFKISSLDLQDRQIFPQETSLPAPIDLAAFMTAYGRLYITKLAMLCEPGTIQSIDTDGIFTTVPAPKLEASEFFGQGLGYMRLDKTMYDACWFGNKQYESREDSPNAEFTPHIAGLPAYLYKPGKKEYAIPRYLYDVKHNRFFYKEVDFTLMFDDEEIKEYERTN